MQKKHTSAFKMCGEKDTPPPRQMTNDSDTQRESKRGPLYFIPCSSLLFSV